MYQASTTATAAPRTDAGSSARSRNAFERELKSIARRILFSADCSESDRQLLHDVMRGRYPMVVLQRLMSIASRSRKPEDREAIPELVRAKCLENVDAVKNVALAFDLETEAQGRADIAQRRYERDPSAANEERVLEALTLEQFGARASIDAVQADSRAKRS